MIDRKRVAVTAGLSVAAGIHLAVAATHELATSHGAFFAVASVLQLTLAVIVARTMARAPLVAAATSSVVLLGTWFAQRFGPGAVDGPGALDAVASASELLVAVAATSLLLVGSTGRARAVPRIATMSLVAIAAALSFAARPSEHDHHHANETRRVTSHREATPIDDLSSVRASDGAMTAREVPTSIDPHVAGEPHEH